MKTLETERLILRNFEQSDLDDLYEYASVEGVGEAAGWPHHKSKQESQKILDGFIQKGDVYAVVLKESGKVIGSLGIHDNSFYPNFKAGTHFEIGYVLAKPFWGKGIMAEAVRAAVKYAFDTLKADVLWCGHFNANLRSKRVVEKTDFVFFCEGKFDAKALNKSFYGKKYFMTKELFNKFFNKR